ncbi:MAG: amidohydrolase [Ekhidna sp.]|nr:amidohydrolase [Ekhidna sp.]MBC6424895.1 amidohydrolase [Ekhidna sp.]
MKKYLSTAVVLCLSLSAVSQKFDKQIEKMVAQTEREVIEWRHWFHQNAELSNREFKTAERITSILKEIGYEPQTGVAKTGVVAVLKGGKPGPVVGLRADIDGLPVKERVELPWASNMTGEYNGEEVPVMHACGHDTHLSILLGVAKMLWKMKDEVPGTVKFIFQPAEEGAPRGEEGGAKLMVEEGVLKNPDVDAIFGLHINAQTSVGKLKVRSEGIMAAVNSMRIDIKGKQAHGSRPWNGIDPVVTAAQIINNLQTIISRNMELTEAPAVITIGAIHGGVRYNIIPEDLYMLGTIRTLNAAMRTSILQRIREVATKTAEANNAEIEIWIDEGYPVTYNETGLYKQMFPTLERIAGKENVEIIKPITGAEDFSFYQKEVPGLFFFIGGCPEGTDPTTVAGHHTPDFYVDDAGMALGMKTMMGLTLDYMSK